MSAPTEFCDHKADGGNAYGRLRQRRQTKFGKVWQRTERSVQLVVSYFNWIWQHSQLKTTAVQRAGLTDTSWSWADLATYPTLL